MKKLRNVLAILLALVLAVAPMTCASAEGAEKVLNIATFSGAGDLDPAGIAIDMWTEYCKMCVDPLIRFDADGDMVYEAAESHEVSEDGLVWTFHLRENGKWSDGSPVTAEDFINTIHRALNPENGMSILPMRRSVSSPATCCRSWSIIPARSVRTIRRLRKP